jgi:outer membrane biogenesis lipoprotein LolB
MTNPVFMKLPLTLAALAAAILLLNGCATNRPHPNDFAEKTHRTYNPETGTFEQSPPWGKESNKSDQQ